MAEHRRWSDMGEMGFVTGMRILFWLSRHSTGFLKLVLRPVLFYYFITNRAARESSLDYLRRLQDSAPDGSLPEPNWRNVYSHMFAFAHSALDKLSVWAAPERFANLEFESRQLLLDQIETGRGAVLLGAHLGNMEVCRRLSQNNEKMKLNVLVHTRHADMFNKLLRELNVHYELELIEVSEMSPATAIRLSACIERGEFVAIMADRIPVSTRGRSQPVSFLGAHAHFPEGPFILASVLKCPAYTLFCTHDDTKYVVRCEKFAEQILLPRGDRAAALTVYMQKFACILEKNIRKAPMQWFNFYPFWNQPQ
ncbi:MAG: acyltransferase [Halieaceae bacterium]|jgi:predicted LPLAT superfamily acyltransferase|nr:acyltransferase [Halieaceae bacterium]